MLLIIALLAYFVPTAIAMYRDAQNTGWITLLNALLGWTLIGWIAALIWAIVSARETPKTAAK